MASTFFIFEFLIQNDRNRLRVILLSPSVNYYYRYSPVQCQIKSLSLCKNIFCACVSNSVDLFVDFTNRRYFLLLRSFFSNRQKENDKDA